MSQANMVVFNQYVMPLIMELYPQAIQKFNAASNNTLQLQASNFDGDYMQESFYRSLQGASRRVDRYAANGVVAPTDLIQAQSNEVKVAGGFGPVLYEPSQMSWLQKPTQEGVTLAASGFVEALLVDQLNTLIAALVAASANNAGVTTDVSVGSQITQQVINAGLAKFGDRSQVIGALIMTGLQYHTLVGQAIDNSNNLFEIGGTAVRTGTAFGQGRAIIITDAPALVDTGKQKVLGLVPAAGVVKDGGDIVTNIDTTNGKDRIETTFQSDYTFGVKLKGYSWDQTNGGKSPSDAALATGSNWDKIVTSDKDTAGIIIIGDE